jgi:hypothetical protein
VNKEWNIQTDNSTEVNLNEWESIKIASENNSKRKLNEKGYLHSWVKVISIKS